ncbi:MAG: hypothetical protein LBJ77_03990 [Holosporales bacterium]|jgi:hypothetical protein|nr:hypothetical protein [Holosporales bacterium]
MRLIQNYNKIASKNAGKPGVFSRWGGGLLLVIISLGRSLGSSLPSNLGELMGSFFPSITFLPAIFPASSYRTSMESGQSDYRLGLPPPILIEDIARNGSLLWWPGSSAIHCYLDHVFNLTPYEIPGLNSLWLNAVFQFGFVHTAVTIDNKGMNEAYCCGYWHDYLANNVSVSDFFLDPSGNLLPEIRVLKTEVDRLTDVIQKLKVRLITSIGIGACGYAGWLAWHFWGRRSNPSTSVHKIKRI